MNALSPSGSSILPSRTGAQAIFDQEHRETQRSLHEASTALETAYNRIRRVQSLLQLSDSPNAVTQRRIVHDWTASVLLMKPLYFRRTNQTMEWILMIQWMQVSLHCQLSVLTRCQTSSRNVATTWPGYLARHLQQTPINLRRLPNHDTKHVFFSSHRQPQWVPLLSTLQYQRGFRIYTLFILLIKEIDVSRQFWNISGCTRKQ